MNLPTANKKDGFTIIEVVLVLAIAGLIFLIVFLAVPALQRSQRDTQRRSDMTRFISQIQNYQSNNKGQVPTPGTGTGTGTVNDFVTRYLLVDSDTWADPSSGETYTNAGSTAPTEPGSYLYTRGATCDGEALDTTGQGERKVAVQTKLEGGAIYCASN